MAPNGMAARWLCVKRQESAINQWTRLGHLCRVSRGPERTSDPTQVQEACVVPSALRGHSGRGANLQQPCVPRRKHDRSSWDQGSAPQKERHPYTSCLPSPVLKMCQVPASESDHNHMSGPAYLRPHRAPWAGCNAWDPLVSRNHWAGPVWGSKAHTTPPGASSLGLSVSTRAPRPRPHQHLISCPLGYPLDSPPGTLAPG